MEKNNDHNPNSEELNLKLQLIKNELMSNLGAKSSSSKTKVKSASTEKKLPKIKTKPNVTKIKPASKHVKAKKAKKIEKIKKKKKTEKASEDLETETDTTSRKWDDNKGKKLLKGNFSSEEESKVLKALCEYAFSQDLEPDYLLDLITEKQTKKDSSVWTKIAECIPSRSVQSIHNFCHRKLNPYNYKGDWSDEEVEKLIQLHKEHGTKWELIGKELERTATNIKDKFKQIGGKNYKSRVKEFNLTLCLKLVKYVQNWLCEENEAPIEIFKCAFKFKKDIEKEFKTAYFINEPEKKILIDMSLKETNSRIIIKNIVKLLLDSEVLEKIIEEKFEISWSVISKKFSVYSPTDCKNNWDKILRDFDLVEKSQIRKDLKMIKHLLKCEYDSLDEINYSIIKNKRTSEENKDKLEEIVRLHDIYSVKSLPEILSKVRETLEQRLNLVKNDVKEFQEELKKNKPLDIGKIYHDFLNNKRGRK